MHQGKFLCDKSWETVGKAQPFLKYNGKYPGENIQQRPQDQKGIKALRIKTISSLILFGVTGYYIYVNKQDFVFYTV